MKTFRSKRVLVTALVAAATVLPLAQAAHAKPEVPEVPTAIAVADGNKLFLVGHAVGVQIYACNAASGGYSWGFVGPRADLYGDRGKLIATHFGGPTWLALDGSWVVGKKEAEVSVDASAIAWLRLSAAPAEAGPDGGKLADTTFIQRVATTGGLAPAAEDCHAGTVGTETEVPYTADYNFWK
jgi:Protein of unknown function (DUF3455)